MTTELRDVTMKNIYVLNLDVKNIKNNLLLLTQLV